eukprot:GFYU01011755.1.p1 GENE.GFYU01011755.1~~GFYU01011755.1.p1  ORF type:complete len:438 (+),score=143.75 GFYU01011755.1:37-1314(+)
MLSRVTQRAFTPLFRQSLGSRPQHSILPRVSTTTACRALIAVPMDDGPRVTAANRSPGDKLLFTPGPLTTSHTVKQAMLADFGSRDTQFVQVVQSVRDRLVKLGHVSTDEFTCIPVQGAGTFSVEAMVGSVVPRDGKLLVCVNGAYGNRILQICEYYNIDCTSLVYAENQVPSANDVDKALTEDPSITDVITVHSETTTGILNPIEEIGPVVRAHGKRFLVDAMSSFPVCEVDLNKSCVDFMVSSANKTVEGVPGFSFTLARLERLHNIGHKARSLSLDLKAQYEGLENNGQFRFTPPTHAFLAFYQALNELEEEGGPVARRQRYGNNQKILIDQMTQMGFEVYLTDEHRGPIITTFKYPDSPNFDFEKFYTGLSERGHVIYPGKLTTEPCFRVGHIGRIFEGDVVDLCRAVRDVCTAMGVTLNN